MNLTKSLSSILLQILCASVPLWLIFRASRASVARSNLMVKLLLKWPA